jgi:alpha-tubulin suppressor-like RCC1 family protein
MPVFDTSVLTKFVDGGNDPSLVLYVPMDGANGSTTFADYGPNGLSITAVGDAKLTTTQARYGTASGIFDGTGDYLTVSGNNAVFSFTGDFTVEFWVNFSVLPTASNYAGFFFSRGASAAASAFQFYMFNNAGTYRLETTISVGSTDYGATYNLSSAPMTGIWYHVAFVRSGSSVLAYWNGSQVGSTSSAPGTTNTPSQPITIGGRGSPYTGLYLNGLLDQFLVTRTARYNANFTPPSSYGGADLGGKGFVLKDYIIDVYPNLIPGVKTPALWAWGDNYFGQLGDGTAASRNSPVQNLTPTAWKSVQMSSPGYSSAAQSVGGIKTDGTLWMWGYNQGDRLGTGSAANALSSPTQTVTGGTNWKQLSLTYGVSYALKTDGTMWAWSTNYGTPGQVWSPDTDWNYVSQSPGFPNPQHIAGIRKDGTLWLWGTNNNGQLGDNTSTGRGSPVQTVLGGTWLKVQCGALYTVAIRSDGTLWCWGANTYGQLGDNTTVKKSSPIQIIASGSKWSDIAVNFFHTMCVNSDGTLWGFGGNGSGLLGDGTSVSRSSPVQTVAGGSSWKSVSCGYYQTAAVKKDGSLWAWGLGNNGALGDSTSVSKSSPVQTAKRENTWKMLSVGRNCIAAIADGNY